MFTWIPAYQQLAQHVLQYENRQPDLIAILKELGITNFNDQDTDGSIIQLTEIDGLSFFCYLNKYGDQKRLQFVQSLCTKWNITPLPQDVEGLPNVNAQKVWLFPVKRLRTNDEIRRLWAFYKAVVTDEITPELFDDVLSINGVGKAKLTEVMFMLKPHTYLCLNRSVKLFLEEAHLPTHFTNLAEYRTNINIAKEVFSKSFPELSKEAYEYVPGSSASYMVAEDAEIYGVPKPATVPAPLNLILYGPPGTGKTYTAINKAIAITDTPFYKDHQDNRTALTGRFQELLINDDKKTQGQIAFCTFHQSMSYEDFIEGIKPQLERDKDTHLQYSITDGIFKTMAAMATAPKKGAKKEPLKYVLIIDEINRGNISQIFGELITLIEDDKRSGNAEALTVTLPYSKKAFSVPPNLYLIGTMNTADRSIETLDTALRRRFVFEEIMPKPHLLAPQQLLYRLYDQHPDTPWDDETFRKTADELYHLLGIDPAFEYLIKDKNDDANRDKIMDLKSTLFRGINLEKMLTVINKRLVALLSNDHTIGHAWFMDVYSLPDLQKTFKHKILPLLQEYFFNNYAKIGLVLGNKFVKGVPVKKGLFASFDHSTDMITDYMDKPVYTMVDPFTLTLEDFCTIYT